MSSTPAPPPLLHPTGRDWESRQDLEAEEGGKDGRDRGYEGEEKNCHKEMEPIIVDPAPQKLAEHILFFVPINLTSPFI